MEILKQYIGEEKGLRIVSAFSVLGLGIVIASIVGSYSFYRVHTLDNTLSVTGSATQTVQADSAKWTISVNRTTLESSMESTQAKVAADSQQVIAFFKDAGVSDEDITASTV